MWWRKCIFLAHLSRLWVLIQQNSPWHGQSSWQGKWMLVGKSREFSQCRVLLAPDTTPRYTPSCEATVLLCANNAWKYLETFSLGDLEKHTTIHIYVPLSSSPMASPNMILFHPQGTACSCHWPHPIYAKAESHALNFQGRVSGLQTAWNPQTILHYVHYRLFSFQKLEGFSQFLTKNLSPVTDLGLSLSILLSPVKWAGTSVVLREQVQSNEWQRLTAA